MSINSKRKSKSPLLLWFSIVIVLKVTLSSSSLNCILVEAASSAKGECSSGTTFKCPNCGGIEVTDCLDCDGYLNTDEDHNICFSRSLFNSHNTNKTDHDDHYHHAIFDIIGTLVWFCAAGVATACGVGGGGIYVPLGMLLLRFAPKPSSGLSQASIFGASLGGLVLNLRNRHPETKIRSDGGNNDGGKEKKKVSDEEYLKSGRKFYTRPLIDYDMALFLAPMEMAGAVLGVLIQKLMPNWLYLLISGCILAFTSRKTYLKFFASYAKEKKERAEKKKKNDEEGGKKVGDSEGVNKTDDENDEEDVEEGDNDDFQQEDTNDESKQEDPLLIQYLEEDARQYPQEKLGSLILLWIGLVLLTFFKGGKGVESLIGIDCTSFWYAILIVAQFLWTLGFAAFFAFKLLRRQEARDIVGYPYLPNDVCWDQKKIRFYATFTFVAGIVAGLIGIGGGMVLGPLMLVMGIHPRVSSATTATMIVLTSSSVAVLFVTSGLVPISYAVYFFCICLCGAYIGKRFIDGYVKRTGMASILIFILATIIALATIGCFVIVFTRLAANDWCLDGFKKFCDVSDDEEACPVDRLLTSFHDNVVLSGTQ